MVNLSQRVGFVALTLIFALFLFNIALFNCVLSSPEYPDYGSESWQKSTIGNHKILVIPVMFSDVKNSTTLSDLNKTIKNLTEYYYNVSYGKLNLSYDIIDWITLPRPMAFYGADGGFENTSLKRADKLNALYNQLVNDTVNASDQKVDFSKYDHLIVIHAGDNQANNQNCTDCIWTMRFPYIGVETNDDTNVDYAIVASETDPFGVYAHEFGHELGLPDLYDTNTGNSVVYAYELMDLGAWYNAHPGAFSKLKLNFVNEFVIYNETKNITIFPAENNDTIIKIIRGNPDSWQYYLIELRKKTGYDANLPLSYPNNALLIWKIDESFSDNQISKHAPMVSLSVYNETGNFTDMEGGVFINWTLNLNNATLFISQIHKNLSLTNRVLDNDIIKPVTCKSLDVYEGWPENDPQTFILTENETDYFTLNDNEVIVWAKIIGNVNDIVTFEFINASNNAINNIIYKNISMTITKIMSRNLYNFWNWFIDTVNVSFKINSSVIGNWSVKILINNVYAYSINFTISDKIDAKPPEINLLSIQNITKNTAIIVWNASDTGINASGLKEYVIHYYDPVFGIYDLTYKIDKKEEIKEFMKKTFYGTPGHTYCFWVEAYDRAGNHNASDTKCVTLPLICNCSTCEECNNQLNNPSCNIVNLIANITNYTGICINNPQNFNNKIFDCQWHTISGNSKTGYGIYLSNRQNNTIRDCIITNFDKGIYLNFSLNNTLINNTVKNNRYGIYLYNSNFNKILNNYVCGNTLSDFNSTGWLSSSGNNNTCDKADGWNDANTIGCTNLCKAKDVFDAVEMLEYLSIDKNLTRENDYYDLNNDNIINLTDVLALMDKIVI